MFKKNKKTAKMDKEKPKSSGEQEFNETDEEKQINTNLADAELEEETQAKKTPEEVISELLIHIKEINDKYLRLFAEYDNYRKRTMKERSELVKSASSDLIYELLPIADDFDRASKSMENANDIDIIKEGMLLINNKFKNILSQKGLEEIKSIGETFNTDQHEAVANVPAESEELKDKIIDEAQKGYLLNGKVLRYAKVVVAN